jgi:hypothetical protein
MYESYLPFERYRHEFVLGVRSMVAIYDVVRQRRTMSYNRSISYIAVYDIVRRSSHAILASAFSWILSVCDVAYDTVRDFLLGLIWGEARGDQIACASALGQRFA